MLRYGKIYSVPTTTHLSETHSQHK